MAGPATRGKCVGRGGGCHGVPAHSGVLPTRVHIPASQGPGLRPPPLPVRHARRPAGRPPAPLTSSWGRLARVREARAAWAGRGVSAQHRPREKQSCSRPAQRTLPGRSPKRDGVLSEAERSERGGGVPRTPGRAAEAPPSPARRKCRAQAERLRTAPLRALAPRTPRDPPAAVALRAWAAARLQPQCLPSPCRAPQAECSPAPVPPPPRTGGSAGQWRAPRAWSPDSGAPTGPRPRHGRATVTTNGHADSGAPARSALPARAASAQPFPPSDQWRAPPGAPAVDWRRLDACGESAQRRGGSERASGCHGGPRARGGRRRGRFPQPVRGRARGAGRAGRWALAGRAGSPGRGGAGGC